jgi:hypothetical protein
MRWSGKAAGCTYISAPAGTTRRDARRSCRCPQPVGVGGLRRPRPGSGGRSPPATTRARPPARGNASALPRRDGRPGPAQVRRWRSWYRWATLAMLAMPCGPRLGRTHLSPGTTRADPDHLQRGPAPVRGPARPAQPAIATTGCAGLCGDDDIKHAPAPATIDKQLGTMKITIYGWSTNRLRP